MKNKIYYLFAAAALSLTSCQNSGVPDDRITEANSPVFDSASVNNDFYDDAETHNLRGSLKVRVEGEVESEVSVDLGTLPRHSVIVKEALMSGDSNRFCGAYRYDGYSLYDILKNVALKKANHLEFKPIIDLYVVVENADGQKAVISWGEFFYPVHRHEILIADRVMRIVPSKTKELWPLPEEMKLVVGGDLITERNISLPVKITVKSYRGSFKTVKDMKPLFSESFEISKGETLLSKVSSQPAGLPVFNYNTVFYGRGRGIHSTTPFKGVLVKDLLASHFPVSAVSLSKGFFVFAGADGYRCVYTFSEILNRNDQAEAMLVHTPGDQDGGNFRLFPAGDFFSDRAVKGLSKIIYTELP